MTKEERYNAYLKRHEDFYRNPSIAYIEPFRIYGPLYYVGDRQVCVHLIDTGDGLLLIDAGFPQTLHMLVDSIWRLGFNPRDIRCILHTHGHFDHFGASNEFRHLYGCNLAISKIDADLLKNNPQAACVSYANTVTPMAYIPPEFQIVLNDGEIFRMGNVAIHCVAIPGHTPGAMAFFFDVEENGVSLRAGLFGGAGLNSVRRDELEYLGEPRSLQGDMLASIEKVRSERVDIMLGNHPGNNDTLGRRARQLVEGGNPFIDPTAWGEFLNKTKASFEKMFAQECAEYGEA